jgi:hypothetical protein
VAAEEQPPDHAPSEQSKPPEPDRREPFIEYLVNNLVPEDKTQAERLMRRARNYIIVDNQ